jgi:hypothetical protein
MGMESEMLDSESGSERVGGSCGMIPDGTRNPVILVRY